MNRASQAAIAAAVLLTLLAHAGPASAKVDPRFSIADPVVVGDAAETAGFRVELRDVNNAPQFYRSVTLDFSGSAVRLLSTQEPGTTLNCAAKTLTKPTDLHAQAIFHPRFGGCCNANDVLVLGDGIVIRAVPARSTDLDGTDGCAGLGDLARFTPWLLDQSTEHPEADFDDSGGPIGLGDFAIFVGELMSGNKGSYCP